MLRSRLPVELVSAILRGVALLDVQSLRDAFAALDTFDPELIRLLLRENKEKATHDILETGDLQCIRCAIKNGAKLDKGQYTRLLHPYRSDVLRVVWETGYSCLTKRAKLSWWDFAERIQTEDDMLDLLSFHKKLRGAPITRDAAGRLVDRGFTRVIHHLVVDNYNVPWLRYLAILHPEKCPGAGSAWELFQKLFITNGNQYVRGHRLDNCGPSDFTKALRVVLSEVTTAEQLKRFEAQLDTLAAREDSQVLLREAKIRLGFPTTQLRLPNALSTSLAEQMNEELLNEAIKSRVFSRVEREAVLKIVGMGRWTSVKNLLFHVGGVWDVLLDVMCGDPFCAAVAHEILPVAGTRRPLTLRQATLLLRRGHGTYLAAHDVWGRSMALTYVAVGAGLLDFVELMLTRMGPLRTFGDTAPFNVQGAIEMARERGHAGMAAYISQRFGEHSRG